jgi:hypothetical protein
MATPIKPQDTQEGCNPISSNCVIWQGPNIPCLSLCTGDSVSDVVAKLASELCTIIDELKISAYDLSCFDPMCPTPTSFQAMIQLLIDKVCALYNIDPTTSIAGCPDCEVNVATCLITKDNLGNDITTLQLKDYVILIGNKICTILTDIASQGTAIADLETRVTFIEDNCCNQSNVPTVATSCITPSATNIPVTAFASALETAFCTLQSTIGTPIALQAAFNQQCQDLGSSPTLDPASPAAFMSGLPGWVSSPSTVADSFTNMWLTICDMRGGLIDLIAQVNECCAVSCSSINLTYGIAFDGDKNIQISPTGTFPSGYDFCPINSVSVLGSNGILYVYDTPLTLGSTTLIDVTNPTSPPFVNSIYYFITVKGCYTNGDSTCTQVSPTVMTDGTIGCPDWSITAGDPGVVEGALVVEAPASAGVSYTITLFNNAGAAVGVVNIPETTPPSTVPFSFSGLAYSITYTAKLQIAQGVYTKQCQQYPVTTTAPPPTPFP